MESLFFALLGAIFGSFINVVIYRLPRKMQGEAISLSWPPSFCPHCRARIKARDNIPLVGWLWLRGRSRCCQKRISVRYPAIEALMALLFAVVIAQDGANLTALLMLALLSLLVAMCFIDIDHMLLPDVLTYPFMLLALIYAWSRQPLLLTLQEHALAAAVGFLILWLLNYVFVRSRGCDGIGGGDMKLFAGIGAWHGLPALFDIMLIAALIGLAGGLLLFRATRQQPFPFGPAIIIVSVGWAMVHSQ
ncbi:prepilin peptidase [Enterobacter asburiae]|nr:prepilin peptidase [Enterobacter asburiae]